MSLINITSVQIKNNPAPFSSPISMSVTFECLKPLTEEIDWKLVYVGSSKDDSYDQELESFSMGPLEYGVMQFDIETDAPDSRKIPQDELIGVTALILSTSYKGKEFFRIGYYVYNNYMDEQLLENPPEKVKIEAVYRNILLEKPRLTRFQIDWEDQKMEEEAPVEKNGISTAGTEAMSLLQEKFNGYQENLSIWQGYQYTPSAAEKNTVKEASREEQNNPFFTSNSDNYESVGLF